VLPSLLSTVGMLSLRFQMLIKDGHLQSGGGRFSKRLNGAGVFLGWFRLSAWTLPTKWRSKSYHFGIPQSPNQGALTAENQPASPDESIFRILVARNMTSMAGTLPSLSPNPSVPGPKLPQHPADRNFETSSPENSPFSNNPKQSNITVRNASTPETTNSIRYSTIHKFKGLESVRVLQARMDAPSGFFDPKHIKQFRYVGGSKAQIILHIFERIN